MESTPKERPKRTPKDPSECVFCIILNSSTEKIIYQDELVFCFYDKRRKKAKEHILVCPKVHIQDADCLKLEHLDLLNHMQSACAKMLEKLTPGCDYRFGYHEPPINSIGHLHLHGITLPMKDDYLTYVMYGKKLTSTEKLIEKIKVRSKKVDEVIEKKALSNVNTLP